MDIARKAAGWAIIAAGSGLAAISGVLAFHGFETMISIPFAGWIGPCVAASLIGLGIAVESEVRARRWVGAAILGGLLISAGLLDRHSGELALASKVEAAAQAHADRAAKYNTALAGKADAEKTLAGLAADLTVLNGRDVIAVQKLVGATPDGKWKAATAERVAIRRDQIEAEKAAATATRDKWADVVAAGAPVSELPFSLADASLYASLITVFSIVMAFAGSYVAHGMRPATLTPSEREALNLERQRLEMERAALDQQRQADDDAMAQITALMNAKANEWADFASTGAPN